MTEAASELSAGTVIGNVASGAYPREVILTVARGFLPLSQDDLIAVLAYLSSLDDAEIASLAQASLAEIPIRTLLSYASNEDIPPDHLALLVRATKDVTLLEPLIRNRAVADAVIAELALHAEPSVQDVIVINQARILRAPEILDALLANPNLTADARRRALETKEEFFEKRARLEQLREVVPLLAEEDGSFGDLEDAGIADLLAKAVVETPVADPLPISETEQSDNKKRAIWAQLLTMSVSEKVQMAFKGNKTVRMFLVRERNKLICSAVMRNPRMTENEVESIATMRNVDEEVLRLIGMKREWITKYNVAAALVRNPKAPLGIVLPLINRLTLRDLKGLKDDKGVSEAVRVQARKFFIAKSHKS